MPATKERAVFDVPLMDATADNIKDYGVLIGAEVHRPGLAIPFYASVEEGKLPWTVDPFTRNRHGTVMNTSDPWPPGYAPASPAHAECRCQARHLWRL